MEISEQERCRVGEKCRIGVVKAEILDWMTGQGISEKEASAVVEQLDANGMNTIISSYVRETGTCVKKVGQDGAVSEGLRVKLGGEYFLFSIGEREIHPKENAVEIPNANTKEVIVKNDRQTLCNWGFTEPETKEITRRQKEYEFYICNSKGEITKTISPYTARKTLGNDNYLSGIARAYAGGVACQMINNEFVICFVLDRCNS